MNLKHIEFLEHVKNYIKKNPDCAAYVSAYVEEGLNHHIDDLNTQIIDTETALLYAIETKLLKDDPDFLIEKLNSIKDKSKLNWETKINKLEKKIKCKK